MIDSELPTDLRRPCTPSRGPASPTPRNLRFRGDPGSVVLAHPLTNGIAAVLGAGPRTPTPRNLRFRRDPGSGAPGHRTSRRQSESFIYRSRIAGRVRHVRTTEQSSAGVVSHFTRWA